VNARIRPLEYAANFFYHFVRLTAFLENILYSTSQTLSVSLRQVLCCEDNYWHVRAFRALAQVLDELESIHLGHHQVEEDETGDVCRHLLEADAAVFGFVDSPSFFLKKTTHHLACAFVVFDDENAFFVSV
jgi:hypothetical protein